MDEIAHDKAPARMHEPRNVVRPPPKPFNTTDEVTTIAQGPQNPSSGPQQKQVVVESKRRVGDDDPTMLHVRADDASRAKGSDSTTRGVAPGQKTPAPVLKKADAAAAIGTADTVEQQALKPSLIAAGDEQTDLTAPKAGAKAKAKAKPGGAGRGVVIAVLVVLALAAAAVGLYLGGVIKM